jgi:hypothetical protein
LAWTIINLQQLCADLTLHLSAKSSLPLSSLFTFLLRHHSVVGCCGFLSAPNSCLKTLDRFFRQSFGLFHHQSKQKLFYFLVGLQQIPEIYLGWFKSCCWL